MDTIFVRDLRIYAVVGIFAWEREVPQELVVNLEMAADLKLAAASGNLEDTCDYSAVARRLREFIVTSKFHLLETLAEQSAAMIMREFNVPRIRLRCEKIQALHGAGGVGVEIERGIGEAGQQVK